MSPETPNPRAELEERLRFETLIADLSSKFINLAPGDVDREIMDAQRRICELLDLDFSALWQRSDEAPGSFNLTHFHGAVEGAQPPGRMNSRVSFPWVEQQVLAGRTIALCSLEELPVEAARDREVALLLGIKSNLTIPLSVGGQPAHGALGVNTTRAERDWPEALVKRLQLVAQIFANALARKCADQALRESEERFRLLIEQAPEAVVVMDLDQDRLVEANAQAERLFGCSRQQLLAAGPQRFYTPEQLDGRPVADSMRDHNEGARRGETVVFERTICNARGQRLHCEVRLVRLPAAERNLFRASFIDITERKRAEEAFRASEARLAAGTELAGLGYYEVDYGERTCFLDDRFREICGVPPNVQQGLEPVQFWIEHVHPDDRQLLSHQRQELHEGKVDRISAEYRYLHPAHGQKWLHHSARFARRSPAGDGICTYGVVRDITQQKRAEMEAQELRGNLAHAGRVTLLGQLASALAHELSQPLGAILRNAEAAEIMLQASSPDLEELRAIVTDILKDDQRAGQVIDRLRSLLKRRSLDLQPVELPSVITEVLSLVRADAAARQVKLAYTAEPGLPLVRGDRIHLQQVLLNLLVNAMDALDGCPPDQRLIQVSARRTDPATVEVRVSDNGPGIPGESLGRLFEPFFTTKAKGMGLGLPVSKTIIEAHQGRLWAENGPEGGACFCFTVPVADGGK